MLRLELPPGGELYPRCGLCCAGPGPLGERRITTACCDEGCRKEALHRSGVAFCCAGPGPLGERRNTTVCCDEGCREEALHTSGVVCAALGPAP